MAATPDELVKLAQRVARNSRSIYSKRLHGCAVLTDRGAFLGCRVENSSTPNGICAVSGAIAGAICGGASRFDAASICIISATSEDCREDNAVCGHCREQLREFGEFPVYLSIGSDDAGGFVTTSVGSLLPGERCQPPFVLGVRGTEGLSFDGFRPEPQNDTSDLKLKLIQRAIQSCSSAYTPYSRFPVGAAVNAVAGTDTAANTGTDTAANTGTDTAANTGTDTAANTGTDIFIGANVELSSIGCGFCAERAAIAAAVAEGRTKITLLAVVCALADCYSRPCGQCRQTFVEFGCFPVLMVKLNWKTRSFCWEEADSYDLLPGAFSR